MRRFERAGWICIRTRGSHHVYAKAGHRFVVPYHGGKDLSPGLVRTALKKIEEVG